jgi:hypothetical protein
VKSQRERDQEKREQKLKDIDEAVEGGRLVIRKMSAEERRRFPARERTPKPGKR